MRTLVGTNRHYEQSCRIPDIFDKDVSLLYHRECRSKFTNIQTLVKRKFTQDNTNEISKKRAPRKESFFFPNHCMFCKKARITVNKKEIKLSKIITKTAEETLVNAATLKNDYEMLGSISGVDLIAKEFQKHETCYRKYTQNLNDGEDESEKTEHAYQQGNFNEVCKIIDDLIIEQKKCMSLQSLLQIYGPVTWSKQYRCKLKARLLESYGDKILFVTADINSPQLVISKMCLETNASTIKHPDEFIVKKAANILKCSILKEIDDSSDLPWPPTVESLKVREPPEILKTFYNTLLQKDNDHHSTGVKRNRLINSFSSDLMYALSNGKYLTQKSVALGIGLHTRTGMKSPIQLLNRLGHCISYDQLNQIETSQAELVQKHQSQLQQLPLIPISPEDKVSTFF